MLIVLTDQERDKFGAYLLQEAESSNALAEQMEKAGVPVPVIKKFKTEVAAFLIVRRQITGGEEFTIEPPKE